MKNQVTFFLTSLAIGIVPQKAFAMGSSVPVLEATLNILTQVGYHNASSQVTNSETHISHRYSNNHMHYFFPNEYASQSWPHSAQTVLNGNAPLTIATHQRVNKGVHSAPSVQFYYRIHKGNTATETYDVKLEANSSAANTSLNLLPLEPNWALATIAIPELANASEIEYWFKFSFPTGETRWDSNFGNNYWVKVAPSQGFTAALDEWPIARVDARITAPAAPKSLRIQYTPRDPENCRMVGYVSFFTKNQSSHGENTSTFSTMAFHGTSQKALIEGVIPIPSDAVSAKVHFERAQYNYECETEREPENGEFWEIPLTSP
jgi:hypothetical protein